MVLNATFYVLFNFFRVQSFQNWFIWTADAGKHFLGCKKPGKDKKNIVTQ